MIIAPTITPAAALDQNVVKQSQQQQAESSKYSRLASITVQVSSQARELAGTENKQAPEQQKNESHIIKQAAKAIEFNQQQAINPSSKHPESNKIDIVV